MNYKKLGQIIGKIMIMEGILMLIPLLISFIYKEDWLHKIGFIVPISILWLFGFILQMPKPKREELYQKEGFALTTFAWIIMTIFGALPFVISGDIPNYIDACFEMMSGFTTTGSSVVTDLSQIEHSTMFWRIFSHWIGGMGILVFVLIFIPESNNGSSMHLLRAESPGPKVGKLVSKMKVTTRILYLIYICLTILEIIILMLDEPIAGYENEHFFFSILTALGCAGTGGFGFIQGSLEALHPFSQYVISIFLILFGINFSLYYLILIKKIKDVFRSEEFRSYFLIIAIAVALVFISLVSRFENFPQQYTTEEAFRHSLLQVKYLMTKAGYSSTDFDAWPMMSKMVLLIVMLIGGMAGSTAGGIKVSRIVMAMKGFCVNIRKLINPRYVPNTKFEGKTLESETINGVFAYLTLYFFLLVFVTFLLAFDPINGTSNTIVSDAGTREITHGFFSNFSATIACLSNVGPGFEAVGPYAGFAGYSIFSKILLIITMLVGRLEILPVLMLFNKKTWTKI